MTTPRRCSEGDPMPTPRKNKRELNAAELIGTHNRLTFSPDLLREIATEIGYDEHPAFDGDALVSTANFFDITDVIELLVRAKLADFRLQIGRASRREREGGGGGGEKAQ